MASADPWIDTGLVDAAERPVLLARAPDFAAVTALFAAGAGLCTLLVVADASGESGPMLCDLAATAIAGGVRAVGICGADSGRFEDCFDEARDAWASRTGEPDDRVVMTWSVKAGALDEAWFLFERGCCVADCYSGSVTARLLVIGSDGPLESVGTLRGLRLQ